MHVKLWRIFRRIRFETRSETGAPSGPCYSLLDEECAAIVTDPNEQFLLWRPKYATLLPITIDESVENSQDLESDEATLQIAIDAVIKERQMAQFTLSETDPDLRRLQTGVVTAFGAFIPRTASKRHRERELSEDRKSAYSTLIATSLVTNCPEQHTIQRGIMEERVVVTTIIAEYKQITDNSTRYLFLEPSGVKSLEEALENGQALTRLTELNDKCRNRIGSVLESLS
jgi:hypothetical protein